MASDSNHKIALITGITGQDGAFLADLLLKKGYEVHGIKRRTSMFNTARVDHIYQDPHLNPDAKFVMHHGDLTDATNLIRIIQQTQPTEIYNLAAQSHVHVSFESPEYTADADGIGTLRILEAIRILDMSQRTKFYQASTSELYGKTQVVPQSETTPFYPRSPYGAAKLYAYWITVNYREAYNMFACNGILFNHESPIRGETFVTRKISRGVARVTLGLDPYITLGNLDARRDWGHARDYVRGMWEMMQIEKADDFVLATGKVTSVRDFVRMAFKQVGTELEFKGRGVDEVGLCAKTGRTLVMIDPHYFRPTEVDLVQGDASKAKRVFGWEPTVTVEELCREMVEADLFRVRNSSEYQGSHRDETVEALVHHEGGFLNWLQSTSQDGR